MKTLTLVFISCLSLEVFSVRLVRKLGVPVENYAESEIDTFSGVQHYGECAKYCHRVDECAAISYNSHNNECKIYSQQFTEDNSPEISPSTMYFSKNEHDCSDVNMKHGSGVYRLWTPQGQVIDVFCEAETDGGPWTVVQNRDAGNVDFNRTWQEYKTGFGDLQGDFWLGNDNIHILTQNECTLRIEMETFNGTVGSAEYSVFQIADEADKYRIRVDGFSGKHGNSLAYHNGYQFSTYDGDNDLLSGRSCAELFHAAWWYRFCAESSLNGPITSDPGNNGKAAVVWLHFFPEAGLNFVTLRRVRMMIKVNAK